LKLIIFRFSFICFESRNGGNIGTESLKHIKSPECRKRTLRTDGHSTAIPFFIPEKSQSHYILELFDLKGRETFKKYEVREKGIARVKLDLSSLAAGIYGYRLLENGKAVGTRKLVVIK
jgi:hypothetical protein